MKSGSLFTSLVLALSLSSLTAFAGDAEMSDFYGASDDGKFIAVTNTVIQDGSGITRSKVIVFESAFAKKIAEISTDDDTDDTGEGPGQPVPGAGSIESVIKLAQPTLTVFGISPKNQGIILLKKTYSEVDWAQNPSKVTDTVKLTIPKNGTPNENYVVEMKNSERMEIPAPRNGIGRMINRMFARKAQPKMCFDLAPMSIGELSVALTKTENGKIVKLAENTLESQIADTNRQFDCAFHHSLIGVRQFGDRIVVIRGETTPGFEGPSLKLHVESTRLPVVSSPGEAG